MARIRIYQIAKETKIPWQEVIEKLKSLGIPVKPSASSTISESEADKFYMHLREERRRKEAKKAVQPPEKKTKKEEKKAETPAPKKKKRKDAQKKREKREEKDRKAASPQKEEKVQVKTVTDLSGLLGKRKTRPHKKKRRKKEQRELFVEEKGLAGRVDMEEGTLWLPDPVLPVELAELMEEPVKEIVEMLKRRGISAGERVPISFETAVIIGNEYGFEVLPLEGEEERKRRVESTNLQPRPPVVTVMGHVDHGKTTLLDYICSTKVAEREAGGITQHIGAYQVKTKDGVITFIDTPGHYAFTTMRARGASVTDIVILVVAADDGVMPQTVEAINHAKVANVPIVVAINKIDKPGVNPDRVKQDLSNHGLVPEEWGGETIMVEISAKTGQGVDELLEMVLLQAEMLDLKADPTVPAKGTILEARLDTKRGVVATVIVQEGTLKRGDAVVAGLHWGKIRALFDHAGKPISEAGPSVPVEVLGISGVPMAGEAMVVVENERKAREISQERQEKERDSALSKPRLSLEEMMRQLQQGKAKELKVVLKTDVHGSLEAVRDALEKAGNEEVEVKVIHGGVGGITESDILLAASAKAVVVGFNVRPDSQARQAAERERVEVRLYRVIYDLLDDVKKVLEGMLGTETQEEVVGRAEIREVFSVPKIGKVAGCYVLEGNIQRTSLVRLIRDGVVIHEGKLASLKRFKDDVKEVAAGYECGMSIEGFQDIKTGDIIEAYTTHEVARKLEESKA